jgi:DNA-binding transcriptional regulator GbsR (MarR family)
LTFIPLCSSKGLSKYTIPYKDFTNEKFLILLQVALDITKNNHSKIKKELGEHLFDYLENEIKEENPELSKVEVFSKLIKEWDKYKKTTAKKEKTNNKITEISNDLMKINIV